MVGIQIPTVFESTLYLNLKLYISGKLKEDGFQKRQCSLHIAAWSIPFILTTVLFVTNVVESDSLSGI